MAGGKNEKKHEQETEALKVASSRAALDKLLTGIESGEQPRPDWIRLQGQCRLDQFPDAEFDKTLARLHGCVKRGFKANNVKISNRKKRLAYWRAVARRGFHDFSEFGWTKAYDSPFCEDYDYVGPYLEGGLEALDPYAIYSAVLGTHDFTVEDFIKTELCSAVRTIAEPMAGTAEFSYLGHFRFPDFRYVMIDLDEDAQRRVLAQRWLPATEKHYLVADALADEVWQQVKSLTSGESLAYIGKQSHHLFDARQLFRLMDVATRHVDFLMLETPQMSLVSDMTDDDDLTRPEMEDAGFEVSLIEEPGGAPNPFTNLMAFRLEARDKTGERPLFRYHEWTNWSQPTLVAFAELLDLESYYFHSEQEEFVPVAEHTDTSDCLDNVTFMIFRRRRGDGG